jgi:hypothetical protein
MAMDPLFDRLGTGGDGVLNCGAPRCAVCWLWPRPGEGRTTWLARLRAHPTPRYVRHVRIAPPVHARRSPE